MGSVVSALHIRWYRRRESIRCDELGAVVVKAPYSGWYLVENRYGRASAYWLPWSFLRGLILRRRMLRHAEIREPHRNT